MEEVKIEKRIQDAIVDMMSKVRRVDDGDEHWYEVKETGYVLQGVSTVSSIVPKEWLSAWGSKEAVKFLGFSDYEDDQERAKEVLGIIKEATLSDYLDLLREAKGAARKKSKDAMVDGTKGHEWLEKYVKSRIRKQTAPPLPGGILERPITQFLDWEEENVAYWILSEARIAHPEKGYAGTLDAIAKLNDGRLALVDFKFASHISEDYHLQTAGYAASFEPYGIQFDARIIIRLPKTVEKDEWDKTQRKYRKVENKIEVYEVVTPYEEDKLAFFHALPLKQWINRYAIYNKK